MALDGEGREGHKVPMPERPLLKRARKFTVRSLGCIPSAVGNHTIKQSFGKSHVEDSEQFQLGAGPCYNR